MRSRVAPATSGLSRRASETVAVETPSASAMVDSFIFCASASSEPPKAWAAPALKQFKPRLWHEEKECGTAFLPF
jgi:hypothetical protein